MIPTTLKIGAHRYAVERVGPNTLGNDRDGYHDPEKNIITINGSYSESHQWAILMHEIIHAINGELEERETEYLAQNLTQVLLDNNLLK